MTQAAQISLKTLLVPSKASEVEYPGMPGFKIQVAFLSRETLQKIRKKSTTQVFKNRMPVESLDDELFLKLYVEEAIQGWTGLTLEYLEQLAPVDLTGQDPKSELAFSNENALFLMKSSTNFDSYISEQVTELANFIKSK